ncbi:proline-rich domain-containing protein [Saccharomonospora xinjiangensis]|uniref:proline-rich domain-containing protein n=1 Tax=Saccharomonospora xinjiangensis TaxID=75294 RepID=UPI0010C307CF|nr:proline-rich domain-containing protein [Saccharomonospora xinjiangensis]QBQ60848.1 hypothetical protein EYD13_12475 [Saccharomonospora xinjiangensis]
MSTPEFGQQWRPGDPGLPDSQGTTQPATPQPAGTPYAPTYPQGGYPATAQPPQYGFQAQPFGDVQQLGQYPAQPPGQYPHPQGRKPRRRGLVVGLVVALVLAIGGGATWWVLTERASVASGSSTPEEAASRLLTALGDGDVVGLAQTLEPAEASLLGDMLTSSADELKRLGMLTEDADLSAFSGITLTAKDLRFDSAAAERINDRVTITKLTGGTLTVSADLRTLPLTPEYRDAIVAAAGGPDAASESQTFDIASLVRESGAPISIAAVNVDGEWYPSLFYTFTHNILTEEELSWPQTSIPAVGAYSPTEAVRQTLQAALDADLERVIELLPPDEMAVLHDAGPMLVESLAAEGAEPSGIKVVDLKAEETPITNGTKVTITTLTLEAPGRGRLTLVKDGDCYTITAPEGTQRVCGSDLARQLTENAGPGVPTEGLAESTMALAEEGLGLVTTEVEGKHYVSPLRSYGELAIGLYRNLTPEQFKAMLSSSG